MIKILIFLGLIALDYITGVVAAYINKTLNSKIGLNGLFKKGGIALGFIACYLIEYFLLESGYAHIDFISSTYLLMYTCNEFISIFENLDRCGVKLPNVIKTAINNITGKNKDLK